MHILKFITLLYSTESTIYEISRRLELIGYIIQNKIVGLLVVGATMNWTTLLLHNHSCIKQ